MCLEPLTPPPELPISKTEGVAGDVEELETCVTHGVSSVANVILLFQFSYVLIAFSTYS